MIRFSITFLTVFVLCGVLSAGAQEMMWENITALHFAATGGTDEEHALQQWLLFDTDYALADFTSLSSVVDDAPVSILYTVSFSSLDKVA